MQPPQIPYMIHIRMSFKQNLTRENNQIKKKQININNKLWHENVSPKHRNSVLSERVELDSYVHIPNAVRQINFMKRRRSQCYKS